MLENPSPIPTKNAEEIELEKNKQSLSALVARRSSYFQQDGENLDQKKNDDKKNFIEEFLAPYLENFTTLKQKWQGGEVVKNTEIVADFLAEKIDSLMEKYLPSSPQEKDNVQKALRRLGVEDTNKIKLKSGENLIDQLKKNRVDLDELKEINNKINMTTIINPFSQDNQSIPIKLKDGRELRLDVKQYAEDLFAHNQLQKNTDANSRNGSQTQQIELSDILDLYGKHKFNEKFPQEGAKIPLSDQDIESIKAIQANANASDQKREEALKKFAEKFGFKIENNKSPKSETTEKIGKEDLTNATKLLKGILKSPNTPDKKPGKRVQFESNVKKSESWSDRINSEENLKAETPPRGK